jgi:hypothetical protein
LRCGRNRARSIADAAAVVRLLQGDLDGADRAVAAGLAAYVGGTEPR